MSHHTTTEYVVGNKDCQFSDILRLVMDTKVSLTYFHLYTLMMLFKTQDPTKSEVEQWSRLHTPSLECLEKMLKEWRLRMSAKALLSTFIANLRTCNPNTLADVLQDEFWPGSTLTESIQSEGHPLMTVDKVCHPQRLNPPQKRKTTKDCFLYSYKLWVLAAAVIILIPLAIIIVNNKSQNRNPDSSLSQVVPNGPKFNETMTKKEINYFNMFGAELDESIILPDKGDNIAVTESTQFRSRHTTELVVKSSEVLNEFFMNKIHWDNLVRLEFNNSLGQICGKGLNEVSSETVNLPQLQELVLDVSKDCEILVDTVLNNVDISHLKILRFKSSITNVFVQQAHKFLHRYYRTLEEFHLMGSLENTLNLFETRNTVVLSRVKIVTVKFDQIWDTTVQRNIVNDRFCSIFPRLATFETKNILISFNELLKLQNCSNLENINTTVRMNADDVKLLEQLNWKEKFPSLKYIAVYFRFDVCPDHTFFEELISKFNIFGKYKLCSNCNLSSTRRTIYCMNKSSPTQYI